MLAPEVEIYSPVTISIARNNLPSLAPDDDINNDDEVMMIFGFHIMAWTSGEKKVI